MSHPLVLSLFTDRGSALNAAQTIHELGVDRDDLSIVCRNHDDEGMIAEEVGGSPGAEIEDSRAAGRFAEIGGRILAAIALVLPGIGPIVGAGPLSANLGEAAGHVAGGIAGILTRAGLPEATAVTWQARVQAGAVLVGVHVRTGDVATIRTALRAAGASDIELARWE